MVQGNQVRFAALLIDSEVFSRDDMSYQKRLSIQGNTLRQALSSSELHERHDPWTP